MSPPVLPAQRPAGNASGAINGKLDLYSGQTKSYGGTIAPPVPVPVQPVYETSLPNIDQSKFYGSQYFFDQLGYDPGRTVAVLADNYSPAATPR